MIRIKRRTVVVEFMDMVAEDLADIFAPEPATGGTYLRNQAARQVSSNGLGKQFRA